ncbi:MAG: glycosyltransferase [Moorea sp. SIO3I6]|nr:glycosyltransferase [Moorena sp. SIO3I6]
MKISYVIPTLNSALTLERTLLSLRTQKNVDVTIIVVDSGSADETLEICKRWNVNYLYIEPGNIYRAINLGLRQCDSEWLGYLNSDDWLYPDSVARLITLGNASKADFVYGNCDFTDFCGRFMYSFAPPQASQLISISRTSMLGFSQQSAIFRKSLYTRLKGFNQNYQFCADREFYLRALNSGASFAYLHGPPVSCFRIHINQLSHTKSKLMQIEGNQIHADFFDHPSFYDRMVKMQWQLRNIPHYLLRFLRQSLLSGRPVITKSMHPGPHLWSGKD